jgi:hypothetical protein
MWLPNFLKPRVAAHATAQYYRAPFYPVGAGDAVYEPAYPAVARMTPAVNFSGAGVLYAHTPSPYQGPQVYTNQTSYIAGIGGPLAGQFINQPLNVPETTNGSQ